MSYYPKVGSLWKYTGQNPAIRIDNRTNLRFGNPSFEVLPESSEFIHNTDEIALRVVNGNRNPFIYLYDDFYRYFIPANDIISDQLAQFRAMIGEAVFDGVTKEEIYDILVAIEI